MIRRKTGAWLLTNLYNSGALVVPFVADNDQRMMCMMLLDTTDLPWLLS